MANQTVNILTESQIATENFDAIEGLSLGWIPVGGPERSGSRLRCHVPCKSLRKIGIRSGLYRPDVRYDVVVFQRKYTFQDQCLAATLKSGGCKTILDLCDNDFYNPEKKLKKTDRAFDLLRMMELVDLITVSSVELQKVVLEITNKPAVVVEEYLDYVGPQTYQSLSSTAAGALKKFFSGRTRLVWFGYGQQRNPETGIIYLQEIIPLLDSFNRKFPLSLSVISNDRKKFDQMMQKCTFPTRYFPWNRHTFSLLLSLHDICLIPLQKNPFTVCKSQNRLTTSLLHRVAVIADEIPSYQAYSKYVLFGNWEKNLLLYLTNRKLRLDHVQAGSQFVRQRHDSKTIDRQWLSAISSVLERCI